MTRVNLEGSSDKAVRMLRVMANPKHITLDKAIPAQLIRQAHGIAFVSVFKTGMSMLGGSSAGGCVLAKLRSNTSSSDEADRWSAPSCISCSGLGGALLGGERLDCMLLLNTKSALRKFLENEAEAVVLGANISLAIGPIGEDADAHLNYANNSNFAAVFSYCLSSKGRGATQQSNPTLSIHGTTLGTRSDENRRCYGSNVTANHILNGETAIPPFANALLNELDMLTRAYGDYEALSTCPVSRGEYAKSGRQILLRGLRQSTSDTRAGRSNLPPGWETAQSSDGVPYYFNTSTGINQWELPVVLALSEENEEENNEEQKSDEDDRHDAPPHDDGEGNDLKGKTLHIALYTYVPQNQDELRFSQGDEVEIIDASDPNWWQARLRGHSGVVPSNYF